MCEDLRWLSVFVRPKWKSCLLGVTQPTHQNPAYSNVFRAYNRFFVIDLDVNLNVVDHFSNMTIKKRHIVIVNQSKKIFSVHFQLFDSYYICWSSLLAKKKRKQKGRPTDCNFKSLALLPATNNFLILTLGVIFCLHQRDIFFIMVMLTTLIK